MGVKPPVVLEKLKNNIRKESEDRVISLSKLKETEEFSALENLYTVGINPVKREDLSASLKGRSNISSHLREIIENANKEVIVCTYAEEMASKQRLFKDTFDLLRKNGIKIKISLAGDEELIKKISQDFDIKIKKTNINAKFFIIDRKEILFYLSDTSTKDDQAIWLNSDFFSKAFAELYDIALKS